MCLAGFKGIECLIFQILCAPSPAEHIVDLPSSSSSQACAYIGQVGFAGLPREVSVVSYFDPDGPPATRREHLCEGPVERLSFVWLKPQSGDSA